jgi:hypothetical protein
LFQLGQNDRFVFGQRGHLLYFVFQLRYLVFAWVQKQVVPVVHTLLIQQDNLDVRFMLCICLILLKVGWDGQR